MWNYTDEGIPKERRESDNLPGDAVSINDESRKGLALLARMIARAYLRGGRPGGRSDNVEGTSITPTGESILQDSEEVAGETRANGKAPDSQ